VGRNPDRELFLDPHPRYDSNCEVVSFVGEALGYPARCVVSREVLEDHFGADGREEERRLAIFQSNRSRIERIAKRKYLS
jgi:Protein of unknown function (DUF1488)